MTFYPLYQEFAHLWPMLAPLESYEEEMVEWTALIEEHFSGHDSLKVLDLGTGGGHHLYHLFHQNERLQRGLAVDLSKAMLERVQGLIPQVETRACDMTTLECDETFPLVCVHDSFCYLQSVDQVASLFATIKRHLKPGGLALVKVDAVKDSFSGPYRYLTNFEEDDFDLTLTHYEWDPDPEDSVLEVIYLFLEQRAGEVTTREERHHLGLFSQAELLTLAEGAELMARFHSLEPWDEERDNLLLILLHREVL